MVYRLIWAPAAKLDLKDLAAYIAEDNPTGVEDLSGAFSKLCNGSPSSQNQAGLFRNLMMRVSEK